MKKLKIGLYFGSFNPIHLGHLIIANHMLNYSDLDRIWFVVSPCNPLKNKESLLNEHHRLYMVKLAIDNNPQFKASDVEFKLPVPSYSAVTLAYLTEMYPNYEFNLIMGSDNLQSIRKWKNYEVILENYDIYVYPRPNTDVLEWKSNPKIHFVDAPQMDISASSIRKLVKEKKSIQYLVPEVVAKYIDEMMFYL